MIGYRASPGGGAPIVEAGAGDIEAMRPMLLRHVRMIGAEERHVQDVVQDTMLRVWEALRDGGVRGAEDMLPDAALRGFARMTAWFYAMNLSRRGSGREVPVSAIDSPPILVSPDPMAAIEAADLLARVRASSPIAARVVDLAARGLIGADAARAAGMPRATFNVHERKLRAALRDLGATQAPRPTWKTRKRKR